MVEITKATKGDKEKINSPTYTNRVTKKDIEKLKRELNAN